MPVPWRWKGNGERGSKDRRGPFYSWKVKWIRHDGVRPWVMMEWCLMGGDQPEGRGRGLTGDTVPSCACKTVSDLDSPKNFLKIILQGIVVTCPRSRNKMTHLTRELVRYIIVHLGTLLWSVRGRQQPITIALYIAVLYTVTPCPYMGPIASHAYLYSFIITHGLSCFKCMFPISNY